LIAARGLGWGRSASLWWITTKASIGRDDFVAEHLRQLHEHLLRPMDVETAPPATIDAAINEFVARRDILERTYNVSVPRALETEVRAGIRRTFQGGV
jgi:hypothetical protein